MKSHSIEIRTRFVFVTLALLTGLVCLPAMAMDGGEVSGPTAWALVGGLFAVLALGLYLQSTRRRTA
jgi:multidrug efflux pump subunit AcrB